MTKKYEYKTVNGMLKGIKITTTEHVKNDTLDKQWMDSIYIELLLNLDERWRTPRQLIKYMTPQLRGSMTTPEVRTFLTQLKRQGLVEYRKPGKNHAQYRRAQKLPDHIGSEC
jgi:hypothetical protein